MSNDFSPINTPSSDTPMFAATPSWERGKKRRSFAGRDEPVTAEPRSFGDVETPTTLSDDARAYEARTDTAGINDTSFAAAPVYAARPARKGNGAAPIAIAAGVVLLGGLAAAGYYAYQPHNTGIAELTPGSTATTSDAASTAPAASEQQVAQNTPPAAAARTTTTTTTSRTKAPARSTVTHAASRSVSDTAANASATAPVQAAPAPMPTPAAPTAAAPPAPLVLNIPPAVAVGAAAPATEAPAPAPTQTPPS
jgi:cytoskeletal protein RodZ